MKQVFDVGDRVIVKDVKVGTITDRCVFVDAMQMYCGKETTIKSVRKSTPFRGDVYHYYTLDNCNNWVFASLWLTKVDDVYQVVEPFDCMDLL